jgi:hypothetical protein
MKIYINERIQEDNFLEYIKNKLNLKKLEFLGTGAEGITFAINLYKVIKFTRTYPQDYEPFLNKNFNHLMNVYNVGEIDISKKFIHNSTRNTKYIKFSNKENIYNYDVNVINNKIYYVIAERLYDNIDINDVINAVVFLHYVMDTSIIDYSLIKDYFLKNKKINVDSDNQIVLQFYQRLVELKNNFTDKDIFYLKQLIKALEELFNNNIDGFDLRINNVLFTKDGDLKLIDYDNVDYDDNLSNIRNKTAPMKNRIKI